MAMFIPWDKLYHQLHVAEEIGVGRNGPMLSEEGWQILRYLKKRRSRERSRTVRNTIAQYEGRDLTGFHWRLRDKASFEIFHASPKSHESFLHYRGFQSGFYAWRCASVYPSEAFGPFDTSAEAYMRTMEVFEHV